MTKKMKKLMVTLLTMVMLFTAVPSTAMAVSYPYDIGGIKRDLDLTNGQVTLVVDSKIYNITKPFIVTDAACDAYGTVWMKYKSGNVYWWSYNLQKDEAVIKPNLYTTGVDSLDIEGDYVVGLKLSTGLTVNILSLEEQKKVLGITDSDKTPTQPEEKPSQPDNSTQPEEKPSQPDNTTQPEEKPSQPTNPTNPTQPEQKPSQTTPTPAPSQPTTQKPTTKRPSTKQPSQTTTKKKTTTVKAGKVIHKGSTYYVYSTKGKVITKFSLTKKGGKFTWRGYSMKGVIYVGMVKKSKNIVVLTKKAGYVFNYETMKRMRLYNVKKYGKPIGFDYDNNGFAIRLRTWKPRRINIRDK